ncbi:hypothetical protein AI28_20840 [bacteria symbiont BFo1 of Frankliniella occidentalis]|nr:hypothetical protein AI28_20840 [bacteria symbiont BFo1 of Frankliniella occidentalis]
MSLNHSRLTVNNHLQAGGAGGEGSRGGNGAQQGNNGVTYSGKGGEGANGGMGGAGAAGGNGGNALIHVTDSTLSLHSITLGGNGASGGQGGDAALNAPGGMGGAGGHGGQASLRFENSKILNGGIMQLGGNGGKTGSDGSDAGATAAGRGGQGGNAGNGYAQFNGGSGQIATDIQLGGKNGGAGQAGSGQLTITAGSFSANSLSIGQADTQNSSDNQYLQTGGIFTTERSALHAGALRIDGGLYASSLLDASRGLIEVTKQAAAIIGTRQLNAERWQQGAEWMAQQQAAPFDGTLVIAAGQSANLSSADVGWSVGSNDHQQHFAGSSLTVISAKPYVSQRSAPLLTGEGRIDTNAKMMVIADDNLKTTEAFTASLGGSARDGFWQQQNIVSTSRLLNMIASSSGNAHRLSAEQAALPLLPQDTADLLADMAKQQGVNTHSADASQRFVSQVMDIRFIRDRVVASRVVQSALHMASVIGVQHTTFMALSAAEQAVARHLASDLHDSSSGGNLWATLLSDNSSSHGFSSGEWQARAATHLGGVALGSDYRTDGGDYGSLTSGIALNAGGGKSSSRGNVSPTRNDFNFWGSTLYSSWQLDAASVMADVSYTGSHNRLKQQTPAGVDGSALRAGVNSWAVSSGIKVNYLWQSGLADVEPHAGVRYTLLKSEGFKTHNELGNLFDTASGSQSIWSFPLGVSLSKAFTTTAGYQIKPTIDLTWTGNSGDVTAKSRSWMPGEEGSSSTTHSTITDHSVFSGNVGIELSHQQLGYSLNYQLNESSHTSDNIIQAGVKFSF